MKASSFGGLRSELRFIGATHDELRALLADAARCATACAAAPLTFPTYRLVPDARWMLDARRAACARAPRTRDSGAVAVYIAGDEKFERRFGRADGVSRATNRAAAPASPRCGRGRSSCSSRGDC